MTTFIWKYNPSQPRDNAGRWTDGGGSLPGAEVEGWVSGRVAEDKLFYENAPEMGPDRDIADRIPKTKENVDAAYALLDEQGYLVTDRDKLGSAGEERVIEQAVGAIRRDWNSSSSSDLANATQDAVHELGLSPHTRYDPSANEISDESYDFVKTYARAQYEHTQSVLADRGVVGVTAYRGMALETGSITAKTDITPGALSSFTLKQRVAEDFAENVAEQYGGFDGPESVSGYVVRTKIPASMIWSIGAHGAGTTTEMEIIVTDWPTDSPATGIGDMATGQIIKAEVKEKGDYFGRWLASGRQLDILKYDPNQPRDNAGKWTSGGISGLSATESGWFGSYEVKNATYTGKSGRTYQLQLQDVSGGRGNAFVLTAEQGYDRAGQLQITTRGTDDTAVIDWVETQPEFRRDGLATAMLGFARRDSGLKVVHDTELSPDGLAWSSVVKYDPNQPRDDNGRWTSGGGAFGGTVKVTPKKGSPETFADTRMSHQAPTNDGFNAPMSRVTDIYPEDVLSHNGARYYGHYTFGDGEHASEDEAVLRTLRRVQGHPDAKVTVYRTILARDDGSQPDAELRPGDWVTPSLQYAKDHTRDDRSYLIVEADVPASQLYTDANSLMEWGYDPNGEVEKYDPNQPRDDQGRWTSGGGPSLMSRLGLGGAEALRDAGLQGVQIGSVNVAVSGYKSHEEVTFMQAAHDSMEAVTSVVALPEGARVEFQTARKRDYEMQNWPGDLQGYYRPNTPTMVSVRTDLADNQRATMVHEFAHLLDFEHSGYTQELKLDTPSQPTMELFEALNSGTPYFRAQNQPDWIAYASGDAEVFARGFAQYVALRSPKAGQDLKLAISREVGIGQWTDGQFVPIAAAFDAYFAAKGMTPKR